MASSEDRVFLVGSDRGLSPTGFEYIKLSTVLTQQFIEQLALCLDRGMRLIPNWKNLAWEMNVDQYVIKQLEQYGDFSPTIRLFEHLEVTQPDLVIEQLRKALFEIGRNDLFNLLTTKAGCTDSEKVKEVITSPDIEAAPLRIGLLDEIALALDSTSRVTANWQKLATKLGVPREVYLELGRRSTQNPTYQLFQYLAASRPQMTLKILKEALHFIARNDLFNTLQNLNDELLVKDVITTGSPVLQTMTVELNREDVPGIKNWTHLASRLEVPNDVLREFQEDSTIRKSPTKEVIQWLTDRFPNTTLIDLVQGLRKIRRNDAIQIITEQFPEAIDSSLERLCSSLNDNLKVDLPKDSTGVTFPSRNKKEERGSPFEQIAEKKQQSCYSGGLPDRTDLVGRQGTCELYIDTLTSNKAVEIVAPPGYGKTSVVVEVGHRMIEKGKRVAYVNPRGVTCVEDLGGKIIEALGVVPSEDTIQETFRRISTLESKSLLLIIENIDNLVHIEDKVSTEKSCDEKMQGKYKKDDFLTFLKDIGRCPTIHLALTSREAYDLGICFPIKLFKLQPLDDEDSAHLFRTRDSLIDDGLVKDLVTICGGIPLLICTVLSILQRENPQTLTRRLSTCSSSELLDALSPNYIPNEDRISHCLQVCFDRLKEENQDVLVKISTFPHRFTREQFLVVFQSNLDCNLQTCFDCLKHSSLLRFDRVSSLFSLHPFIRKFFSAKTQYPNAKWAFTRHYSDLALTLCEQFLSQNSKSAIERYRNEKENIREAMTWCGDDHPELHQTTREHCIRCFNKSAVFLAKMMRMQEFESLFCKLSYHCVNDLHLYSACLTSIGLKIVVSCMCTPCICPRSLYRAKDFLSRANEIQSRLTVFDVATRAHCMCKLGFCFVREGYCDTGYYLLNRALELRRERTKHSPKNQDKVMLAACLNDLAGSLTLERKHMEAIQTRTQYVLPVYESLLGDHPFVATTLSWIAFSYQALGDYDNATKFTQRALEIREQLLGPHKETARSFYDLGVALSAKQEYERALIYLKKAVTLQKEVLDTPEELIITHQAIANILKGLNREEEAENEMERVAEYVKMLAPLEPALEVHEARKDELLTASVSRPAEQVVSKKSTVCVAS